MTTHSTSLWLATHPVSTASARQVPAGADYDVVIAGAGLTGLTTAVLLARAGKRVAVLEARFVGAVTTGHTTAKLSLLQGTTLSQIRTHQSDAVLTSYVQANREGQDWLLRYLDEQGVDYQRRTAYTYASSDEGLSSLRDELDACRAADLPVDWTEDTELPFPVAGAIVLGHQAQCHPMHVLDALATELRVHGGMLFEGVRVTGTSSDTRSALSVKTSAGVVRTDRLVLATGIPVLDRGGYFAKLSPQRSYAQAYRIPGASDPDAAGSRIPRGMYLSADSPTRSLRTATVDGEELLMVGGNGHVVGRADSTQKAVDDLEAWTQQHFPGAVRTYAWSAQDYRSANLIPFVGVLPRSANIYVATGFNKWGMTNGVAAALRISAQILGEELEWAKPMDRRLTTPSDLKTGLKDNLSVGVQLATGWVSAEVKALPDEAPAEGQGVVGRESGKPVAMATVDGITSKLSAVCPHLGGVVRWNDAECSWDCPLHGSRFAADGSLLEGPAVQDLAGAGEDS